MNNINIILMKLNLNPIWEIFPSPLIWENFPLTKIFGVKLTQYTKSFPSHFQSLSAACYVPDLLVIQPCSSKLPKYLYIGMYVIK